MASLSFSDNETPSSIYAGYAAPDYSKPFRDGFKNLVTSAKSLANKLVGQVGKVVEQVKKGFKFFADWWKDDPVGATAGAIAAGLSLGLVVVVAGGIGGAITGGIAALRSLRLIALIKAGLKIAAAFVGIGALIRFVIRGVQFMWTFDWNVTDKSIKEQQDALITNLYSLAGGVLGSSLATVVCGVAPVEISRRTGLIKINPMTLAMIQDLTQFSPQGDEYGEVYEEMMEAVKALIAGSTRATAQILFLESYKNIRKFIKHAAKKPGLSTVFPKLTKTIEQWGAEGSQAWSFASATEEWVESIEDTKIKNLTEETIESFMDTCTENAMVVSYLF